MANEPAPAGCRDYRKHPMNLAPHQQRVVDEKTELDDRRTKLSAFYSTPIFHGLPESEQTRLLRQGVAMRSYSEILSERIAAFPVNTPSCNSTEPSPGAKADQRMESEITAAGLDAPRVTADQIQALMDRVVFRYEHPDGTTSTFAHAFLGGFYLATGHSACVSPENYKPALGQKYAREQAEPKARDKLWELEGYALHKQLAAQAL